MSLKEKSIKQEYKIRKRSSKITSHIESLKNKLETPTCETEYKSMYTLTKIKEDSSDNLLGFVKNYSVSKFYIYLIISYK